MTYFYKEFCKDIKDWFTNPNPEFDKVVKNIMNNGFVMLHYPEKDTMFIQKLKKNMDIIQILHGFLWMKKMLMVLNHYFKRNRLCRIIN